VKSDFVPHESQRKIHEALWPPLKGLIVMAICGRRFGKTVLAVIEIIKRAIEIPGSRIWYLGPTKDQAYRIAWRLLLYPRTDKNGKKLPPYLPPSEIKKTREDKHYVELKNGSLIEFNGVMEELHLLGTGLHFVVFDEFPTISFSAWEDTVRPMLSDFNGDAFFIGSVPDPKIHQITIPFLDMYEQILFGEPNGYARAFNFSSFDNPYVDHNRMNRDIEDLKRKGRENDALRTYYGKYSREFGLVFPKFTYDQHTVVPFEIPGDWARAMAVDPHPQRPINGLWMAVDPRGHKWFYREREFTIEGRPMTVPESALEIMRLETFHKEKIKVRVIDPSFAKIDQNVLGSKSVHNLYREYGIYFREANRDFNSFFNMFTDMLVDQPEPTVHFFRNCIGTIRQFQNYTWDSWASQRAREERGAKDRPKKVDDDYVDCAKMLINSDVRPENPLEYKAFRDRLNERWEKREFL